MCCFLALFFAAPRAGRSQGYAPEDAAKKMTLPPGFSAELVASEPLVRQPVAIEFDDRGRLWVVQYLQYPNPAGLKRVEVDRYSRTTYDRVPEPPPKGPKGDDRVTILTDRDGDGRVDEAKDFVAGLNLASGLAFGHGGVFVLQTPYLLFYPDRNGDDVPDGDPDVLLSGFGMEDAHSVANSLTWGPDGWLYGCQGSTVTANIRGIEFQQGVWRYHPITRRFELFCEGGGNSWGLDFDEHGNLLYSTNNGGYCMLHGVQGGYYWKAFGKHGALHNPYAYGYFEHVAHRNFQGGHVTVGGILYRGNSFPSDFLGKYVNADLLGHAVYWQNGEPLGSTFRSSYGGDLLLANDTWFAPSDVTLGPDGSVYVADWCDKRTAHPDPNADWDRTNGRVYRIKAAGTKPVALFDLKKLPSDKLIALLSAQNHWYTTKARRILADRRDPEVVLPLRRMIFESQDDTLALESLWALYVSGGFDESFAEKLLAHKNPDIRRWTVRFLGDERKVTPGMAAQLAELATREPSVVVRSQLACTAKRLPADQGLPIVERILLRNEDGQDSHVPLLLWWAVEQNAVSAREQVLKMFGTPAAWKTPLVADAILERLMRRYAAADTEEDYRACARLLASAAAGKPRGRMLAALDQGLEDRTAGPAAKDKALFADFAALQQPAARSGAAANRIPAELAARLDGLWSDRTTDSTLIRVMARLGKAAAQRRAVELAANRKTDKDVRVAMLHILRDVGAAQAVLPLVNLIDKGESESVQTAALDVLARFDNPAIADELIAKYAGLSGGVRSRTRDALLSRKTSALAFLECVDRGTIPTAEVPVDQLRQLSLHQDKRIDQLVLKHWGSIKAGTPEEKLAEIRRLTNDLRASDGNPRQGHVLFKKQCSVCHRLFDEGNQVGPDLTHANRKDREYLLVSIVDPSAVVRKEFLNYIVQTTHGQVLTGLIAEQTPGAITLLSAKNERTRIERTDIEELREAEVSLMPENLLKDYKPEELRDLFSYLQSEKPLGGK